MCARNSGIALSVVYSADAMGTAHIHGNTFNSSGQEGIAILLSSNTSSVIEANTITNFNKGILTLNSGAIYYNNTVQVNQGNDIYAAAGSIVMKANTFRQKKC